MASKRAAHAVIADDLTGAGDAGVQFAAAGMRTRTLRDDWTPAHLAGAEVVVVDTASRGLTAADAYRRVRAAAAAAAGSCRAVSIQEGRLDAARAAGGRDRRSNGRVQADHGTRMPGLPGPGADAGGRGAASRRRTGGEDPGGRRPAGTGAGEPRPYPAHAPDAPPRAMAAKTGCRVFGHTSNGEITRPEGKLRRCRRHCRMRCTGR